MSTFTERRWREQATDETQVATDDLIEQEGDGE